MPATSYVPPDDSKAHRVVLICATLTILVTLGAILALHRTPVPPSAVDETRTSAGQA